MVNYRTEGIVVISREQLTFNNLQFTIKDIFSFNFAQWATKAKIMAD